jgi:capsular exopolysaccharide synthesis family protein
MVALSAPASVAAEQFRMLHQRLERARGLRPMKVVAVTSAIDGEGKSLTAANLALAAAAMGPDRRILLIDGALRRPRAHLLLDVDGRPGLSELLSGDATPAQAMRGMRGSRLRVLPGGAPCVEASVLLASGNMRRILEEARRHFDEIYLDAPPVLATADGAFLVSLSDGAVLVVRAGKTPRRLVLDALETLQGLPVLGCVLNRVEREDVPHLLAANGER